MSQVRDVDSDAKGIRFFNAHEDYRLSDKPGIISPPPLEGRLVVGEATGMMTFDKMPMVLFLELRFRPTTDSHLCSGNGGRIG